MEDVKRLPLSREVNRESQTTPARTPSSEISPPEQMCGTMTPRVPVSLSTHYLNVQTGKERVTGVSSEFSSPTSRVGRSSREEVPLPVDPKFLTL